MFTGLPARPLSLLQRQSGRHEAVGHSVERTLGKFSWPHTHLFFSQEPPFLVPLHVHAGLGQVCAVQVRHLLAGHSK